MVGWEAHESNQTPPTYSSNDIIALLKFRRMNTVEAPLEPQQPVFSTRIVTITLALFCKKS